MFLKTSTLLLGLFFLVLVAFASIQTVPLLPEAPLVNNTNSSSNQTGPSQNQTLLVQDLPKIETSTTVEPSNLTTPTTPTLGFTVSSITTTSATPTSVTVTAKSVNGSIDPKELPTETATVGSNFSIITSTASPIVTTPTATTPAATETTSPFTVATPTPTTATPSPNSVASLLSRVTLFGGSGTLSQKEAPKSDALNSTSEIVSTTTTTLAPPPSSTPANPNQQHRNVLVVNLENPFNPINPHHVRRYGGPTGFSAYGSDSEVDFEDDDDDAYDPVELAREIESTKVMIATNKKK